MAFQIKQAKKQKEESLYEEEKSGIDEDLFKLQGEEKSKESEKYLQEKETIAEMNQDLESENSPIRIKNKFELEIESNGQKHTINRNDLSEYQRKYQLEDGKSDENAITTFRSLGTINGNYELLDKIYNDSHRLFGKIDGESSYKTTYIEDE